ncbi:MAG TPA: P-II family nitrogen regulator [Clostridiaceae bacterium]|nr:P-II family nitrogen regulator [Clostridiaceae bacterium]
MNSSSPGNVELICIIVNFGLGSRLIQAAKRNGISGGTVLLGRGTVNSRILDFLGLSDVRKEIVYMVANRDTAYQALKKLDEEFKFEKPNHGIAFTISLCGAYGLSSINNECISHERGAEEIMYHAITTIVDKGRADDVIEAAKMAGSKGATVIHGRGSGIHETSKLFNMDIEPEKDIVLILSEADKTEAIISSIREHLKIDEPGKGIIFVQDVNKTYGLYR